jgi:hypothetical protein
VKANSLSKEAGLKIFCNIKWRIKKYKVRFDTDILKIKIKVSKMIEQEFIEEDLDLDNVGFRF